MSDEIRLLDRFEGDQVVRTMLEEVGDGLRADPKELSPKYFYDRRGSELFEEITRLDEYYQTRTERAILGSIVESLATDYGFTDLIEFGSGSSEKTRVLLDVLSRNGSLETYHPIDVSREFLLDTAGRLKADFPSIQISPVLGDFADGVSRIPTTGPALALFLGGTIGNLYPDEAISFLSTLAGGMNEDDAFLLGLDLVKDPARLHAAYNDSAGITAEFNRNVLHVLNRELNGSFDPDSFAHYAFYNPREERIEMHLLSRFDQVVRVGDLGEEIEFSEGETILTEISRKFTRRSATAMLAAGGFRVAEWWTDPEGLFALILAIPRGEG